MGLTNSSTGLNAKDNELDIKKTSESDVIVALGGNPNVGKSTLFNALTGMNQHTGNWPGKTVTNARGYRDYNGRKYIFVDIPGSYSLLPHSAEEEVAGDFICSGTADIVAVVCAASCIERNLNLVLQIMETTKNVIVCLNLMDEAKSKGIEIDSELLSKKLGVPVVPMSARNKKGIDDFLIELEKMADCGNDNEVYKIDYGEVMNEALKLTGKVGREAVLELENWQKTEKSIQKTTDECEEKNSEKLEDTIIEQPETKQKENINEKDFNNAFDYLMENGINKDEAEDIIATSLSRAAAEIADGVVHYKDKNANSRDRRLDNIFSSRIIGFPIMFIMLAVVFWLTISGANLPSQMLNELLFSFEDNLLVFLQNTGMPESIINMLVFGMYRVLAWVVSVMLPPMAVFFPLFTILEDSGYLPRVAFNLDKCFKKCRACGKQVLCMAMGFGCNAAGVTGCRIIDSQRERLVAILTNNFVPCNGRFPMMISVITMFFTGYVLGAWQSVMSALILSGIILLGILMTFLVSAVLTKTVLKGVPSSFILEMPPYRRPKIGEVVVRSVFDRTIFVLGRAISAAAPAGIVIWLMANVKIGNVTVLALCSDFLDPFGRIMGLDGIILMAFILGFPANEIVVPVMLMAYMNAGVLTEMTQLSEIKTLLIANGWTWQTAVSMLLFSLMHWPCATTMLTIKKETGSFKWTMLSFLIPTVVGVAICIIFNLLINL